MRRKVEVHGIVQGVGFRPWVYNRARAHGLAGFVLNTALGVIIEMEGAEEGQLRFLEELRTHPPPLAQIDEIRVETLPAAGDSGFVIRESEAGGRAFVLAPPDIATCPDCVADFRDPANRRFGYPFTNCTNCGPRYTIIRDVPYDRPFTTMAEFRMCTACEAEYHDPADRRFHAQPNACPVCGPRVELWDHQRPLARGAEAVAEARRLLAEGRIVAIKGLGGYHLACDALNDGAVRLLRERKRRSGKPFAVMAGGAEEVRRFCQVSDADLAALASIRRPIVLLARAPVSPVSAAVAPGVGTLGVMLPYTPLHHLLFDGGQFLALVMTSGNLSEEPIVCRDEDVAPRLHPLADFALLHNRKIHTRADDSVVRTFEGKERVLRRSRGFAPHPVDLGFPVAEVLACGGDLKNALCLTREHYAILSQHLGDLENLETLEVFEETLAHMKRFFRVTPRAVAYDLHPQYLATRFALSVEGIPKIGVQHHHAHIASSMAENRIGGKVIGVALDGTGYGTDGKIWGGEFLVCDFAGFERRAHFRYVPLAGGDSAIRQPWRPALAYLRDAGLGRLPFLDCVEARPLEVVERMLANRVNTVETSSCGRLFDTVAAMLGLRLAVNYEGQAAMELEAVAAGDVEDFYSFAVEGEEVDFREAIRGIARDLERPAVASARFHNTLARAVAEVCRRIRGEEKIARVCLSGGTFQNVLLLERTVRLLRADGFEVFLHAKVPPNDGGLALGQAAIAACAVR